MGLKRTTRLKKNRTAKKMPKRRSRKRTRLPSTSGPHCAP
jgi:hypothetical protein